MINTNELEFVGSSSKQNLYKPILFENNFSAIVDELLNIINNPKDVEAEKQSIFNYLNKNNVNLQEIYNWLLNNQINSNYIVMLGCFDFYGIGTRIDKKKAFELYQKAANLENIDAIVILGKCY